LRKALLLIDVQIGFDAPAWGSRNNPDAERSIAKLLRGWRDAEAPVIHMRHDSRSPDSPLHPDAPGNAFKAEALPRAGEKVIGKSVNSAFIGTDLEGLLRRGRIESLVIVGLTTNHCVSTTARMAGNLGFETFIVSDATATFDCIGLDGRMRPATEVHASALSDLSGEFATIVDTATALNDLTRAE
jgi:nicotinamidase-related amidase